MPAETTAETARPDGPLLWLHSPPPEARPAMAELMRELNLSRPDLWFLVTGQKTATEWMVETADLSAVLMSRGPGESMRSATNFLQRWRPDLGLFYPATLPAKAIPYAHAHGTALFLITPDLPEPWRNRWRSGIAGTRRLLRRFDRIFAQSRLAASQLRTMGISPLQITPCGPLSEGSLALACNETERAALAAGLAGRPVWLATCTRPAEEPVVVAAHSRVLRYAHRLLLIVIPDKPDRGPRLAERLRAEGWHAALRSADEEPEPETQIYIADTEGELGLWLRLAPVSFLGGTLGAHAGIDPFQAAALGSAVLHGPATGAYTDRYERLGEAMAARFIRDEVTLAEALSEMLAPERAAAMARGAWDISTEGTKTTERVVRRMLDVLHARELE